jgi:hypothetical protein
MNHPLTMTFRILALAPQVHVRDATGATVCYVRQKLLRLKEHVEVFADESQSRLLYEIRADRMIDFSATYRFAAAAGGRCGGRGTTSSTSRGGNAVRSPRSIRGSRSPIGCSTASPACPS